MNQKIHRALISVSDKEKIVPLARFLKQMNVEIIATGGTAKKLSDSGIPYTPVEEITGNPEAFGGRMKTISFPMISSILFRRDHQEDLLTAKKLNISSIDLVICNLYPFADARKKQVPTNELIEEVDIGGPTMIRSAAKNYQWVSVCTSPSQYEDLMAEMESLEGSVSLQMREKFSAAAFRLTAEYDMMISEEFNKRFNGEELQYVCLEKGRTLRYGENPHQSAIFYKTHQFSGVEKIGIASADIIQGKALSYNNLLDADAAHRSASDAFIATGKQLCAVSIIKHLNPCGLAVSRNSLEALELAWAGDPVSAFGGILCFTQKVDEDCAKWLDDKFIEVLVAPELTPEAAAIFAKKKNLRVLLCPTRAANSGEKMIRSVSGGVLLQDEDQGLDSEFSSVTKMPFMKEDEQLAHFGVMVSKHLRSNSIALVRKINSNKYQLVGAGMGQPNRIDSLKLLAGPRAKEKCELKDTMLVSDAFFPFADMIEAAHELGIQKIIQPGGSIRDNEVIEACNKFGMAMAFTGRRHFRH